MSRLSKGRDYFRLVNAQPEWMDMLDRATTSGWMIQVIEETENFAALVSPGYTAYVDRGMGNGYCPVSYHLVSKAVMKKSPTSYLSGEVQEGGRLTKLLRQKLSAALKELENGADLKTVVKSFKSIPLTLGELK